MSGVCSGVWSWCLVSTFVLFRFDVINRSKFASDYNAEFGCDCEPACGWDVGSNGVHGLANFFDLDFNYLCRLNSESLSCWRASDFGRSSIFEDV